MKSKKQTHKKNVKCKSSKVEEEENKISKNVEK